MELHLSYHHLVELLRVTVDWQLPAASPKATWHSHPNNFLSCSQPMIKPTVRAWCGSLSWAMHASLLWAPLEAVFSGASINPAETFSELHWGLSFFPPNQSLPLSFCRSQTWTITYRFSVPPPAPFHSSFPQEISCLANTPWCLFFEGPKLTQLVSRVGSERTSSKMGLGTGSHTGWLAGTKDPRLSIMGRAWCSLWQKVRAQMLKIFRKCPVSEKCSWFWHAKDIRE